jgi:predicted nucleotidyltransferase
MDKNEALTVARAYAKAVKQRWDCDQIILFGSYAKGTYHEYSDIDIAVVMKDYEDFFDTQMELMRMCIDFDTRIEPHPFKTSKFGLSNPLVYEVVKHGELIA